MLPPSVGSRTGATPPRVNAVTTACAIGSSIDTRGAADPRPRRSTRASSGVRQPLFVGRIPAFDDEVALRFDVLDDAARSASGGTRPCTRRISMRAAVAVAGNRRSRPGRSKPAARLPSPACSASARSACASSRCSGRSGLADARSPSPAPPRRSARRRAPALGRRQRRDVVVEALDRHPAGRRPSCSPAAGQPHRRDRAPSCRSCPSADRLRAP